LDARWPADQSAVTFWTLRSSLIAVVLISLPLALPAAAPAAAPCAGADLMPTSDNVPQMRQAVLCLLNVQRRSHGLSPLAESPQLRKSAQGFSRTMVRESFFDHTSPGGSTLLSRVRGGTVYLQDARTWALGENIAWGSGEYATPGETVSAWMESAGHRHNILNRRFRHVGIGIALGAPADAQGMPAATYTTDFGFRARR
jgi:uncharacterized protein YkwD